jgi:hypothetical protein
MNPCVSTKIAGPGLADMIEETVEALNERDFPTSSSLVSYFNKDLVERLAKEYEVSIERAVALPGDVGRIEAASAELADGAFFACCFGTVDPSSSSSSSSS